MSRGYNCSCMTFKLAMAGAGNVGKSSLIIRFVHNKFLGPDESFTLAASFSCKQLTFGPQRIKLQLWDSTGHSMGNPAMKKMYYRAAQGVVIVFDLTDMESFNGLKRWLDEIDEFCGSDISKVLLGNKSDLRELRKVPFLTAKQFADKMGIPYFETSAKTGDNVDEAFTALAEVMKTSVTDGTLVLPEQGTKMVENTHPTSSCTVL